MSVTVRVQDEALLKLLRGRGLVVIDPTDKQAGAQLAALIRLNGGWSYSGTAQDYRKHDEAVQAALNDLANPKPPIEEPLSLGAVVEDSEGDLWVRRCANRDDADYLEKPWLHGSINKNWQIVNPVRVLSHGYTGEEEA